MSKLIRVPSVAVVVPLFMRTFLAIFLPLALLLGCAMALVYHSDFRSRRLIFEDHQAGQVDLTLRGIKDDLQAVTSDLLFLSEQPELQQMLTTGTGVDGLADEYLSFVKRQGSYEMLRFLDSNGMEVIRVNYNDGRPAIVPRQELQSKADRYFFKEAFCLERGEIYVSPFDLSFEYGRMVQPRKPSLRFATPVFDNQGRRRGIVLLNYLAARLLEQLQARFRPTEGQIMLLNAEGFWLKGPKPEDEWAFMFPEKRDRTFARAFPDIWRQISTTETGQIYFGGGLYTYGTIDPLLDSYKSAPDTLTRREPRPDYWKVVCYVPPQAVQAKVGQARRPLILLAVALAAALAIATAFLAKASVRRQRAEEAMRESEERFRRAVLDAPFPTMIHAEDGQVVAINQAWTDLTGYAHSDIPTIAVWTEKACGQSKDLLRASLSRLYSLDRRSEDGEYAIDTSGGNTRIWDFSSAPLGKLPDGKRLAISMARDVSERKRVEASLRETNQMLHALIEASPLAIFAVDPHGTVTMWNRAAERIFGWTAAEAVGRTLQIVPEDRQEESRSIRERVLAGHALTGMELRRQKKDGTLIDVSLSTAPLRNAEGGIYSIMAVLSDITDRKWTEQELQTLNRELVGSLELQGRMTSELAAAKEAAETASRSKSEFLANMSHEIRTPMTAILGYADLLLDPGQSSNDRLDCIQTIQRNGKHLLSIINDILDLSKIEAGKMAVERINCSVMEIVADVASLMRGRASAKNLSLKVQYPGKLPLTIRTDPTRLRQILMNLVGNAIKFTEVGDIRIIASLPDPSAPLLKIEVTDTGVGIAGEQIEHLFQPFSQADTSTTRKFGGTGLGLTISRRLAHMLGGDISVQSVPGKGSSFVVTIDTGPLAGVPLVDGQEEAILSGSSDHALAKPEMLNGRILLAEDGIDNQRLIAFHVRKAGAEISLAENGQIAVDLVIAAARSGRPFDLILMDMQMPVLDGYGATRRLREEGYQGPIIALTAHAMDGEQEKCLRAGCDAYISKPFDRLKLLSTIARLLHSQDAGQAEQIASPGSLLHDADRATAATTPQEPLISTLASDEQMMQIIPAFVAELSQRACEFEQAMQLADLAILQRLSHQLKGAAGGYGFGVISLAAKTVEELVKTGGGLQAIQMAVTDLVDLCRRALATPVKEKH